MKLEQHTKLLSPTKIKNRTKLPPELLVDIFKAIKTHSDVLSRDTSADPDGAIIKILLKYLWRKYAEKLMTSSLMVYSIAGKAFRQCKDTYLIFKKMTSLPTSIEEEEFTRQNLEEIFKLASSVPLNDQDCKDPGSKHYWIKHFVNLVSLKKASDEKNEHKISELEEELRRLNDFQVDDEFFLSYDNANSDIPNTKDYWMKKFYVLSRMKETSDAAKVASDQLYERQIASKDIRILELTAAKKNSERGLELLQQGVSELSDAKEAATKLTVDAAKASDKALELLKQGIFELKKGRQVSPGKGKDLKCQICGDGRNTGQHYGAVTCKSCSDFFYKYYDKNVVDPCVHGTNECEGANISKCKRCRLNKCKSVGMKKEGSPRSKRKNTTEPGPSKILRKDVEENEE